MIKFKLYLTKDFIKMTKNDIESIDTINAATCLLLSVSQADDHIDISETEIIKDIINDFFNLKNLNINEIIEKNINIVKKSTDIYEFGKILNEKFSYQDKLDFIYCAFEVAFIDNDSHYLEEHTIKKIAYILNVENKDLIKSKQEMKKIFKL